MKQNQCLYRPFGEKTELKKHDFLSINSACQCSQCCQIKQTVSPEIKMDHQLLKLMLNYSMKLKSCDQVLFLNQFKEHQTHLPKIKFLDTLILERGQPLYAIYFKEGKVKIDHPLSINSWINAQKQYHDINYQIKKYERENPGFNFAAFEHQSEKKIKQFVNNIQYKIPGILKKIAYVKLKGLTEEILMSKYQFEGLFDLTKKKVYQLTDIQYIQVFPVMNDQEEHSYVKTIKYFRDKSHKTKSFKLAENYFSTWKWRNQSLQKMEENVFEEIRQAQNLKEITEDMKLEYMTYKILIYYEDISNNRISEAIVSYITNDDGRSFFFKKIECLKIQHKISVDDVSRELPSKKEIAQEDHITLKYQMKKIYGNFQQQYQRLNKQREEMQNKIKRDKQFSNHVFTTITQKKGENLHQILSSNNQKYKRMKLQI